MDDSQDTSGTPLTAHSFEPTSNDSTLTEEQKNVLIDDLLKKRWGGDKIVRWGDAKYSWWLFWAKAKHLGGVHTFVPLEVWDRDAGTIEFMGDRCWICNEGR